MKVNGYGKEYYQIKDRINFSRERIITIGDKCYFFTPLTVQNFNPQLIDLLLRITDTKIKYTSDRDTHGRIRDKKLKRVRQFRGIVAETIVHEYLTARTNLEIHQYDLERTSFRYSRDEYDLKFYYKRRKYLIEVKCSSQFIKYPLCKNPTYPTDRTVKWLLQNSHIIFTHSYQTRDIADIAIGLFTYPNITNKNERQFIDKFLNGEYSFNLVLNSTTRKEMLTYGRHISPSSSAIGVPYYPILGGQDHHIIQIIQSL